VWRIIEKMHLHSEQTTLRMPMALRERLVARARTYGPTLAAEIRAACELALCQRTLWMLQHDFETQARLGANAADRECQAKEAVERLSAQLFGRQASIEELLRSHRNEDRPAAHRGVHNLRTNAYGAER
jgi:hypothetical protein